MARFLVTGAAGFLGRHLVRRLAREGHLVTAVDRRAPPPADLQEGEGRVLWKQADLLTENLAPLIEGAEYCLHLAGQPGVRESWADFPHYARGNLETTQRLLEAFSQKPLSKFVLASTSSVYGEAPMPAREDGPLLPVSPYGATKLAAEQLCALYGRTAQLPWLALRYFTLYGPGQRPDMAFARWFSAARAGKALPLFGSGEQVRDFTYVTDGVEATIRAALASARNMAINVGGGSRIAVRAAIALIARTTGRTLKVRRLPPARGDMPVTCADTGRLQRELAWLPDTSLEEGLARQYQSMLEGESSGA